VQVDWTLVFLVYEEVLNFKKYNSCHGYFFFFASQ